MEHKEAVAANNTLKEMLRGIEEAMGQERDDSEGKIAALREALANQVKITEAMANHLESLIAEQKEFVEDRRAVEAQEEMARAAQEEGRAAEEAERQNEKDALEALIAASKGMKEERIRLEEELAAELAGREAAEEAALATEAKAREESSRLAGELEARDAKVADMEQAFQSATDAAASATEAVVRGKDDELREQEDELRRLREALHGKNEEIRGREEELRGKGDELRRAQDGLRGKEDELRTAADELRRAEILGRDKGCDHLEAVNARGIAEAMRSWRVQERHPGGPDGCWETAAQTAAVTASA